MSSVLNVPLPTNPPGGSGTDLALLRAELDQLDNTLHDTLMRRAEVVAKVGALGVKGAVPLRPGREAAIVRRLLARHRGEFPPSSLVRLWRELICGMTALQRPLRIAVCDAGQEPALLAAAREHFGALTPVRAYADPAEAIRQVSNGLAVAAVLPMPQEDEPAQAAWWTLLLQRALLQPGEPRLHVVARLPFWAPRPEGTPVVQAFVVSAAAPDPSGADRSLIGFELPSGTSRAQLTASMASAGFTSGKVIVQRDAGHEAALALVDVGGLVADADERLQGLTAVEWASVVLGAYAVPLEATS